MESKARQAVMPPHPAEHGMSLAGNQKDSRRADEPSATPPAESFAIKASAHPASTRRGATETVEVSGAAAALAPAPSAAGGLMARNEMPAIEKAKPALPEMDANEPQKKNERQKNQAAVVSPPARLQAGNVMSMSAARLTSSASPALAHKVTWAITAGVLERSLDSGQSWQNALRADRPLLCYASHDEDVWTGGQAGALFHSSDGGVTWLQVQPSIPALSLTSDITHIDVRGPAEVVISTSNREIWSSPDSGKTWEKK
jgi:hypothetical protein